MRQSLIKYQFHKNKRAPKNRGSVLGSDLDRIQTYNLLIRSQMLYSIELRSHFFNGGQIYGFILFSQITNRLKIVNEYNPLHFPGFWFLQILLTGGRHQCRSPAFYAHG